VSLEVDMQTLCLIPRLTPNKTSPLWLSRGIYETPVRAKSYKAPSAKSMPKHTLLRKNKLRHVEKSLHMHSSERPEADFKGQFTTRQPEKAWMVPQIRNSRAGWPGGPEESCCTGKIRVQVVWGLHDRSSLRAEKDSRCKKRRRRGVCLNEECGDG